MHKPLPQVDAALLARAQHGDRGAHSELYEMFGGMVFTLARRMLASKAAAEDVLQDTFIEVFRKIGAYRGEAELGFWVKRIAINKCLMQFRSGWMSRRCDDGEDILLAEPARAAALDDQIALERALDDVAGHGPHGRVAARRRRAHAQRDRRDAGVHGQFFEVATRARARAPARVAGTR